MKLTEEKLKKIIQQTINEQITSADLDDSRNEWIEGNKIPVLLKKLTNQTLHIKFKNFFYNTPRETAQYDLDISIIRGAGKLYFLAEKFKFTILEKDITSIYYKASEDKYLIFLRKNNTLSFTIR